MLAALSAAALRGAATGALGSLDGANVSVEHIEALLADDRAGRVRVTTLVGKNLLKTLPVLRDLRLAVKAASWPAVEAAVSAAKALRARDELATEAEREVLAAEAEVEDRRVQGSLAAAIGTGAARGAVGSLDLKSVDAAPVVAAVAAAHAAEERAGALSPPAKSLLASAELVLHLRTALAAAGSARRSGRGRAGKVGA
jgi:hypothetical protein